MTNQLIPEAAVEAALEAFYANCDVDFDGMHAVKAALEAAAPHIQARAWERGNRAALGRPNPYRTTK